MDPYQQLTFLDVGGHLGQTLDEVLRDEYQFSHVHTFEPLPEFAARLRDKYKSAVKLGRLSIHEFGLSNRSGVATLYGDNVGGGASVHPAKHRNAAATQSAVVRLVRATEFFEKHLSKETAVLMKLNCEGSEGDIILDLVNSQLINQISNLMVDFDLLKVPGKRHEPLRVLKRLADVGFDKYSLNKDVMVGPTHQDRIRNWLSQVNTAQQITSSADLFHGLPRKPRVVKHAMWKLKMHVFGFVDGCRAGRVA